MSQLLKLVRNSVLLLVLTLAVSSTSYAVVVSDIDVTETWDGAASVEFTIDADRSDVIGFAVGTNFSFNFGADVDPFASNPAPSDWIGVAAVKRGGTSWEAVEYTPGAPTFEVLPDFVDLTSFADYNSAFVYYSVSGAATLDAGFTDGFSGYAFNQDSAFAAFILDGDPVTGETNTVPIPGAGMLLLSGIAAIAGIRRK